MKWLTIGALVVLICAQSQGHRQSNSFLDSLSNIFGIREKQPCERDPIPIFREALDDFTVRLTKRAAYYSNNGNFVISPYSIWLSLASVAEFTDSYLQPQFLKALNLPEDRCTRNKLYLLASNIETSGPDVDFKRRRAFAIDERYQPYDDWLSFNEEHKTLDYLPIDWNEENFESIREAMSIQQQLPFYGNSIMLDRLYYQGLWTSAFSEGTVELAPFYNDLGLPMGSVDYMRMKSRVRLAHIPFIDAKVLELPVGSDGRHTMLFTMGVKNNSVKNILDLLSSSIVVEILKALTVSLVPIEVAIPRFFMHHGFNAKPALEDMGFPQVFADPSATRYIADPPPLPSYLFQRLDINITSGNLQRDFYNSNIISNFFDNSATNIASAVGRDFIANRPFFFSLIDKKTGVTIFTGLYAYPEEQSLPVGAWRS